MKEKIYEVMKQMDSLLIRFRAAACEKEEGLDGILVTVGLCIIALLLCVVMKDSMSAFIRTLVTNMTNKANQILTGV